VPLTATRPAAQAEQAARGSDGDTEFAAHRVQAVRFVPPAEKNPAVQLANAAVVSSK
jgi:hypothetical protein